MGQSGTWARVQRLTWHSGAGWGGEAEDAAEGALGEGRPSCAPATGHRDRPPVQQQHWGVVGLRALRTEYPLSHQIQGQLYTLPSVVRPLAPHRKPVAVLAHGNLRLQLRKALLDKRRRLVSCHHSAALFGWPAAATSAVR